MNIQSALEIRSRNLKSLAFLEVDGVGLPKDVFFRGSRSRTPKKLAFLERAGARLPRD